MIRTSSHLQVFCFAALFGFAVSPLRLVSSAHAESAAHYGYTLRLGQDRYSHNTTYGYFRRSLSNPRNGEFYSRVICQGRTQYTANATIDDSGIEKIYSRRNFSSSYGQSDRCDTNITGSNGTYSNSYSDVTTKYNSPSFDASGSEPGNPVPPGAQNTNTDFNSEFVRFRRTRTESISPEPAGGQPTKIDDKRTFTEPLKTELSLMQQGMGFEYYVCKNRSGDVTVDYDPNSHDYLSQWWSTTIMTHLPQMILDKDPESLPIPYGSKLTVSWKLIACDIFPYESGREPSCVNKSYGPYSPGANSSIPLVDESVLSARFLADNVCRTFRWYDLKGDVLPAGATPTPTPNPYE